VGDIGGLNQVFLNLIKNAAESFGDGGGSIDISLRHADGVVQVVVEDDGPGIPESIRESLFEPFFTTKDAGEGTGLGLSISRQIVASHGGTLEVESEEGAGARFTICLPVDPPPSEEAAQD
jgi:signal transduction histidine kinase